MKHKHADLMLEYAKQAQESEDPWRNWEISREGICWASIDSHPSWNINREYRMKKKTINIGGIEIAEPVRGALTIGEIYYTPSLGDLRRASHHIYQGDGLDFIRISSGIVHRNEDDAIKHAIALLGFTC